MFFFETSKENLQISELEINYLLKCKSKLILDNIFSVTKTKLNENFFSRLAYTKKIFKVLEQKKSLDKIDFSKHIKNTYKLEIKNYLDEEINTKEILAKIHHQISNPKVDITFPNNIYYLFLYGTKCYLTQLIFVNEDKPSSRRSHLRKYNYPTSLNPKQAKFMINLGSKKSFLDPFCGAGGILLEGYLMNLKVKGSDISKKMIVCAKENLNEFNTKNNLKVQDALTLNKKQEAIITDLPFGKNSHISKEIDELYSEFFKVAEKLTKTLVIGHLDNADIKKLIKNTKWKIKESVSIYVHKSMTRKITLLQNL